MRARLVYAAVMLAILAVIMTLYWPVHRGGFIWDDTNSLHDQAWLRGDDWKNFLWHGFNNWINYFRPLVIVLFAAELRAFDGASGPMHVVSVIMHLINTTLVGLLARKLDPQRPLLACCMAMVFYGLHPVLVEPVGWVGCQFELGQVMFSLLGLLLNATINSAPWRALAVSASFLAAASFKEAAAAFPLLLVVFDIAAVDEKTFLARLRVAWQRQRLVYAAIVIAGLVYLALRYWALGHMLLPSNDEPLLAWSRVQRASVTYLRYWQLVIWPMDSIGPIHPFDADAYTRISATGLAATVGSIAIFAVGAVAFVRRWPLGLLVLAVSAALLPVVNLAPIVLSESLYHDRYATTATAVACMLLPAIVASLRRFRAARLVMPLMALVWLGFAVLNVRVTVPLWADELALWQWAHRQHPESIDVQQHLLATYIQRNDRQHARELADALMSGDAACAYCMLNAADLALADGDAERAAQALSRVSGGTGLAHDARLLRAFVLASGRLLELRGDTAGAEDAYREAMRLDAADPLPPMSLAMLLARQGRTDAARDTAEAALALFAPDERGTWRRKFDAVVETSR